LLFCFSIFFLNIYVYLFIYFILLTLFYFFYQNRNELCFFQERQFRRELRRNVNFVRSEVCCFVLVCFFLIFMFVYLFILFILYFTWNNFASYIFLFNKKNFFLRMTRISVSNTDDPDDPLTFTDYPDNPSRISLIPFIRSVHKNFIRISENDGYPSTDTDGG
jgi:hypothetical protein